MSKPRSMRERRGWAFLVAVGLVKPVVLTLTRHEWVDGLKIPAEGGAVLAANHISYADPFTFAHLVHDHGRLPRYLAKAAVFEIPVLGRLVAATGQIPVHRLTADAAQAFDAAVEAVGRGRLVVVYPEGTLTRQPDLWPMVGRTGAARIALTAGVPVVPAAQWGAQDILAPYGRRLHVLPPRTARAKVGDPVDLDDLRGQEITAEVLELATERIMDAITGLLEDLRGETAPVVRFDPRREQVARIGNPHREQVSAGSWPDRVRRRLSRRKR